MSGHPLAEFTDLIKNQNYAKIGDIISISKVEEAKYKDGDKIKILAIISDVKLKTSKNNNTFAYVNIEDMYGSMEMMVFGSVLEKSSFLLMEGNIVEIHARISVREDEEPKLICDEIIPPAKINRNKINSNEEKVSKNAGLYIKVKKKESFEYERAMLLLSIFEGTTPVYIFFEESNKLVLAPRRLWISKNDVLIEELKRKIGDKNVVLKE